MNSLKDLSKVLKKSKKVALFTHINPDSDALGSVFALYYALKTMGKDAEIFVKGDISDVQKRLIDAKVINSGECNINLFDTYMCCDVSDLKRLGDYADVFNLKNNTIVLDHHIATQLIGKYNHIDASISSCTELVYDLLKLMKTHFNSKILTCIYMGLTSDTNSFINSNTNEHSFKVAYEIAKFGLDLTAINEIMYKSVSKKEVAFKQYLWTNYKLDKDIAYVLMDYKTLQSLSGNSTDCSGFSSKLLTLDNVNYSFSIIEKEPGVLSISMRSRAGYNVRSAAEKLGGGGHSCAAGAKAQGTTLSKLKKVVIDAIRNK
ncbi:MAG: bifunctional oligoribonuclease/PAP phosphatase NrnA [Clostridia bacterium]|nr:bifunctional oligoribonuclease/PAP phosphatase NrnA [Clostridia bacterium]